MALAVITEHPNHFDINLNDLPAVDITIRVMKFTLEKRGFEIELNKSNTTVDGDLIVIRWANGSTFEADHLMVDKGIDVSAVETVFTSNDQIFEWINARK